MRRCQFAARPLILSACVLVVTLSAPGDPIRITDNSARDWDPSWSPDGIRIGFTSDRTGTNQLWILDLSDSTESQVTDFSASCMHPAWSPDGKRIAFASERSGNQDLWTIRPNGRGARQITATPEREESLGWSHEGDRLTFDSTRSGDWEIWTVAAGGGDEVRLTEHRGGDTAPEGSADGTWIAFTQWQDNGRGDLCKIPSDGGVPTILTSSDGENGYPTWSPDGSTVAFMTDRDGNWDVFMVSSAGGRAWPVVATSSSERYPSWSPDGTRLAYSSDQDGSSDIWILDLYGITGCLTLGTESLQGASVQLAQAGRPKRNQETAEDGCFSYPALREARKYRVRVDSEGGSPVQTTLAACFALNDDPLAEVRVVLKQQGAGSTRETTGADGCVRFSDVSPGLPFQLKLKGMS